MDLSLRLRSTRQFEKDYRQLADRFPKLRKELSDVVDLLRSSSPLPARYRDHPLRGRLSGLRDCHVRGDVVLLYYVEEQATLVLVRIGTHSQLGL
ncbi:MAG: type II toxin-antitoxin system YafQ family toxin [Pseudomonadota bacterium]